MAKKPVRNKSERKRRTPRRKAATRKTATAPGLPAAQPLLLTLGTVFIGLSALMSLLLVLEHLGGLRLPGCGEAGACAQAANSVWGKISVGGFKWPVSYLGLAYFPAALAAWVATRGGVPQLFRILVRLGALVSMGFCVILIVERAFCPYCIAAHIGNIAFWITMESTKAPLARPRFAAVIVIVVFSLVTLALGIWDGQYRAALRETAEEERTVATKQIIEDSQKPPDSSEPPFTGRYRLGPQEAPIRIVMFTDYQCRDCLNIEKQLVSLYQTRTDISISIKHFPFNQECNPHVSGTLHPNSCWAARAAEAAGKLWGPEGFWKMHGWLFDRKGVFETTEQLENGIRELGYDPAGFVHVMSSAETLEAVRVDAAEAKRLGLYFTPMIFINGVELKGWVAPNALVRTVEQVAATHPPARSAAFDQPPPAFEKYIADWREQPLLALPPDNQAWTTGPDNPGVKIVLWGDYQEAGSTQADVIIREFAAGRNDVQYTYRHYPFNSDCNPYLKERRFPNSCRAAKAAEAAGRLGGNEAFWNMHVWLMENREQFSDATLRTAATRMGLDASALFDAMDQPDLQPNILDDIQAGKKLPQLRHGTRAGLYSIPTIFVNGHYVPRWRLDDQPVLKEILLEAAGN